MFKILLYSLFLLFGESKNDFSKLKDGDIIFQISKSKQSEAIQLATHSKYSHVGIVFIEKGKPYVYEAAGKVKWTKLKKFIKNGKKKHFVVKRLKNAEKILTPPVIEKMKKAAGKYDKLDYDIYFEWNDEKIYCSELVWKIYHEILNIEIGDLKQFKDYDFTHPVVKVKLKERFGDNLPEDETVISPASMFDSNLLETIMEN